MVTRACPFCGSADSRPYGRRGAAEWVSCAACRSLFQNLSQEEFDQLHRKSEEDAILVPASAATLGGNPDRSRWRQFPLTGRTVLEIGPGSGHLLAAAREAGWRVSAVETNPTYRSHIRSRWGIESVAESVTDLPASTTFDAIVTLNVLEHIYDIHGFINDLAGRLSPDGRILLATCNAESLIVRLVGPWWSMFKEVDHVAFPTAAGLRALARRSGLRADAIWTTELPLETPVSVLVAARDRFREGRTRRPGPSAVAVPTARTPAASTGYTSTRARRAVQWINRTCGNREPTALLLSRLGWASSVKVTFISSVQQPTNPSATAIEVSPAQYRSSVETP